MGPRLLSTRIAGGSQACPLFMWVMGIQASVPVFHGEYFIHEAFSSAPLPPCSNVWAVGWWAPLSLHVALAAIELSI